MTRSALSEYRRSVLEDDLLTTVTEALSLLGWRWTHARRSDKALMMGHPGVPDILAVKAGRILLLELKREGENPTPEQWAWLVEMPPNSRAVGWMVVKPSNVEELLRRLR